MSIDIFPESTARSAVPDVSLGRGLIIPLCYLHLGKCEHSGMQSYPPMHYVHYVMDGRLWMVFVVMRMCEYKPRVDW